MSATPSLTFGNLESSTYGTAAVTQRRSRATNQWLYCQSLAFDKVLLIERLKAGDSEALETIFNAYSKTLYKVALRIVGEATDTEEVIQDVFWTAFRKAQSFCGNSRFSTWLYRLTVDGSLGKLRQRRKDREIGFEAYLSQSSRRTVHQRNRHGRRFDGFGREKQATSCSSFSPRKGVPSAVQRQLILQSKAINCEDDRK